MSRPSDAIGDLRALNSKPSAFGLAHPPDLPSIVDRHHTHAIAVVLPLTGVSGIVGPSCIASAQLAISEVNGSGGVEGRKLEAVFLDSGVADPDHLARTVGDLIDAEAIAGVVSMCRADIRKRLDRMIAGRVPNVFTPIHNGTGAAPNVFLIGPGPEDVITPSARYLIDRNIARRWAWVGHPWTSTMVTRIANCGGEVVLQRYVRPGQTGHLPKLLDDLVRARPEIVAVSLAGSDCYEFHRAFGEMGLDKRMLRFSPVTEENSLMASGAANTKNLFVASTYFSALDTDLNLAFKERYYSMHGSTAPALNQLGQSVYEGIQFYVALTVRRRREARGPLVYASARGGVFRSSRDREDPCYLAEAEGHNFHVMEVLDR